MYVHGKGERIIVESWGQWTDYSEKSDVSKRKVVLGATKQLNEVWILLKGGDAF